MTEENVNDVEISCAGVDFLVNNDWEACEKLYTKHKDLSPLMNYCSSFVTFLRAVMTFEEQLLEQAQKDLENTEKICTDSTKIVSSFKKAFGLSTSSSSGQLNKQTSNENVKRYEALSAEKQMEEKFTKAIILADCKLFLAILTFIRQEVTAYLSSGILQIRRSWKIISKIQKQLYEIYKKLEPNAEAIYGCDPNSNIVQILIEDDDNDPTTSDTQSTNSDQATNDLNSGLNELTIEDDSGVTLETVKRLLGAASFGYGVFQICLSFMPPNVLKLVKIFGFEGDRNVAIKAINFTSNSKDMRAPFADMVLLWYSTIACPLFGASEADISISDEDTRLILEKNLTKYPKSSLFLNFKGRFDRIATRDLNLSLRTYETASENSKHIREIQMISIYEIGWTHLMSLNYHKALEQFDFLAKESKWSRSFNCYICSILSGSLNDFKKANEFVKEALKILSTQKRKRNPIESFALKRLDYFKKNPIKSVDFSQLLCIELLFNWICFPYCDEISLKTMLQTCDKINEKNFNGLKCLFEGALQIALKNDEFGESCFKESIARAESEKNQPFGKYVLPYAHFQLALLYTNQKKFEVAKLFLNKSKDNFKDYEFEDRVQTQLRNLQRRIRFHTDGPKIAAAMKAKAEIEQELKKQNEIQEKNFFL